MKPVVADIYHGDTIQGNHCEGFCTAHAAGLQGVIHKATQGAGMVDSAYGYRRPLAIAAGLLWGAYHFNTGENIADQVSNFFTHSEPDAHTLMAIDFEDNRLSNMSISQLVNFLELADAKLGRKLVVYGGNRLKEHVGELPVDVQAFLVSHPLWLCQYGPVATPPHGWKSPFLWQYTGDGIGLMPHNFPGFEERGLDLNVCYEKDLAKAWAGGVCETGTDRTDAATSPITNPTPDHSIGGLVREIEQVAARLVEGLSHA